MERRGGNGLEGIGGWEIMTDKLKEGFESPRSAHSEVSPVFTVSATRTPIIPHAFTAESAPPDRLPTGSDFATVKDTEPPSKRHSKVTAPEMASRKCCVVM